MLSYLLIGLIATSLISGYYLRQRAESGYFGAKVFNTFKMVEIFNKVADELGEDRSQALVQGRHIFESKVIEFLEKNRSSQQMKKVIHAYEVEFQSVSLGAALPGVNEKATEIARDTVVHFLKMEFQEIDKSEISSRSRRR